MLVRHPTNLWRASQTRHNFVACSSNAPQFHGIAHARAVLPIFSYNKIFPLSHSTLSLSATPAATSTLSTTARYASHLSLSLYLSLLSCSPAQLRRRPPTNAEGHRRCPPPATQDLRRRPSVRLVTSFFSLAKKFNKIFKFIITSRQTKFWVVARDACIWTV